MQLILRATWLVSIRQPPQFSSLKRDFPRIPFAMALKHKNFARDRKKTNSFSWKESHQWKFAWTMQKDAQRGQTSCASLWPELFFPDSPRPSAMRRPDDSSPIGVRQNAASLFSDSRGVVPLPPSLLFCTCVDSTLPLFFLFLLSSASQ